MQFDRRRFRTRHCVAALIAASSWGFFLFACTFPIDSDRYVVADSAQISRLLQAFAGENDECASAFNSRCEQALGNCAASPACVEFAGCMRERANPAAETTCSDDLGTSLDDNWRYEVLRHCWATRSKECPMGTNFACVGDYGAPSAERQKVEIRQQIKLESAATAGHAFEVEFCPELASCSPPLQSTKTDPLTGYFDATLELHALNSGVGNDWDGYRQIRGDSIPTSAVQANIPLWGRRTEITRLLTTGQLTLLAALHDSDPLNSVFVQVVDCLSEPAPDVQIEISTSSTASVGYTSQEATATLSDGAAAVTGYDPKKPHRLIAVRDGRIVASFLGLLPYGMPHYLRMHPEGKK